MPRIRTPGDGPKCSCGKPAVWSGFCQRADGKGYCNAIATYTNELHSNATPAPATAPVPASKAAIALAEKIVGWQMGQRFQGQHILHAAVCCDFVGHRGFIKAVAELIEPELAIAQTTPKPRTGCNCPVAPHPCPHRAEIHDDKTQCTCCDQCEQKCKDDI